MVFYNEDWIHFLWTRYNAKIEITEEILRDYIYSLKGSQITDFVMNVNGTVSTAHSDVFETFADRYLLTEENGVAVNYKNTFAESAYKLFCKKNDMYQIWIDALNEIEINPWISFRVNDCHGNMQKTDLRKSSYVEANPDLYISSHRSQIGYFDKCFDYSQSAVRDRMLGYIDEMLARYDIYGLELDMMRDFIFTKPGFEQDIKPFLDGVIKLRRKYEKKHKHSIKLSLLLPSSPTLCLERGVNISDFENEIDFITIISRWETTDTDMPIELWKQLLRGTNIKLGGGQQLFFKPFRDYKPVISSVKMAFGQAIANLSRGCDFVYLYNYMDMGEFEGDIGNWIYEDSIRNDNNRKQMFHNIGKKDTLLKQPRSHVVTYADFSTYNLSANPVLPLKFSKNSEYQLVKIPVGEIEKNSKVRLFLGVHTDKRLDASDFDVYVNSTKCAFSEVTTIDKNIYENECFVFNITENRFDIMYLEVKICNEYNLEYVEIEVNPVLQ